MKQWLLPLLLLAEIVFFHAISGNAFNAVGGLGPYARSYAADILAQSTPVLLAGFAMTLVLMTAGIDLSVGSMVALIACVLSTFAGGPDFWWKAVPIGLVLAIALGATNGLLVGWLDIPPIIATLGTMILYRGLCFVVMGDLERAPFLEVPGYAALGSWPGVLVLLAFVFAGMGGLFLRSRWRREILMLGGNRIAARYAGIPVLRRTIEVYTLVGLMAFLAALSFTARNSSVSASSLSGFELPVIVAVVLGGTRVQGGAGSIVGTFFGVLIIAVLEEGLRGAAGWGAHHLPFKISHLKYVLLGLLLILGVWMTTHSKKQRA
jgi:ribose/xylose/arabinose/galactoside ABC-type transport system permease subunit